MRNRVMFNEKVMIYTGTGERVIATEGDLCKEDKETNNLYKRGGKIPIEEEDLEEGEEVVVIEDLELIFHEDGGGKLPADEYSEEDEGYDSPTVNTEKRCLEVFLRQLESIKSNSKLPGNSSAEAAQDSSFDSETTTNPDESLDGVSFMGSFAS